jgi:pyruvate dehydrogenase E1 component alpha subunit
MRGVPLVAILLELLGQPEGLCRGMGGHMHLFSPEHLAASSGIVGASGPAAVGFALAGRHLQPGAVSVAFFGEGAMNEGMLMEALNLAVAWHLPVLFVCKDNTWAITTRSPAVTGGDLTSRAQAFGMAAFEVDGFDVAAVWRTTHRWMKHAREGGGPAFLRARCAHLEGHFLGDPMLRLARQPSGDTLAQMSAMLRSMMRLKGAPFGERVASARSLLATLQAARLDHDGTSADPVLMTRGQLLPELPRLQELEHAVEEEIEQVRREALATFQSNQRKPE